MSKTDKTAPLWVQIARVGTIEHDHRSGECIVAPSQRTSDLRVTYRHRDRCDKRTTVAWTCTKDKPETTHVWDPEATYPWNKGKGAYVTVSCWRREPVYAKNAFGISVTRRNADGDLESVIDHWEVSQCKGHTKVVIDETRPCRCDSWPARATCEVWYGDTTKIAWPRRRSNYRRPGVTKTQAIAEGLAEYEEEQADLALEARECADMERYYDLRDDEALLDLPAIDPAAWGQWALDEEPLYAWERESLGLDLLPKTRFTAHIDWRTEEEIAADEQRHEDWLAEQYEQARLDEVDDDPDTWTQQEWDEAWSYAQDHDEPDYVEESADAPDETWLNVPPEQFFEAVGDAWVIEGPSTTRPEPKSLHYVRVHELARDLGISSANTLAWLTRIGEHARNHMSMVAVPVADNMRQRPEFFQALYGKEERKPKPGALLAHLIREESARLSRRPSLVRSH